MKVLELSVTTMVVLLVVLSHAHAFTCSSSSKARSSSALKMLVDPASLAGVHELHSVMTQMNGLQLGQPHFQEMAQRVTTELHQHGLLLADSSTPICPAWGETGWAPFCFLQGNPVFNTFDKFQAFVQDSIEGLAGVVSSMGIKNPYGPSIILFTCIIRTILLPLAYKQIESSQATTALSPKVNEIKERFPNDKDMQNQLVAMLYEEAETNPLAGCLPSLVQLPVFVALYRSFLNLATTNKMAEPFLWIPNLEGPVYGTRSTDWITSGWVDNVPSLGWQDTIAYLSIPVILILAQSISMRILTPPSDDPAVEKTQKFLKYLPLMIGYFSLSVPAGLGLYWIVNNFLSTATTGGIKAYFKANPSGAANIDIDKLAGQFNSAYYNPTWGLVNKERILEECKTNEKPGRSKMIPADFM